MDTEKMFNNLMDNLGTELFLTELWNALSYYEKKEYYEFITRMWDIETEETEED